MDALRRMDGGGSPEGPERSEGAAQRLDASTAVRHPDSVPPNLTRQPSNNPITAPSDTGSALTVQTRPRLCRRRCRRARQPMPHRPPPRLRHRICLGASHRRRTLASRKRDTPRFSLRRPTQDRASRRRGRPLLRRAHRPHARACDDDDYNRDGVRALTSASGIVCGTSLPPDELRAPARARRQRRRRARKTAFRETWLTVSGRTTPSPTPAPVSPSTARPLS